MLPWYKNCFSSPPSVVTRIKVKGATKLENKQVIGSKYILFVMLKKLKYYVSYIRAVLFSVIPNISYFL